MHHFLRVPKRLLSCECGTAITTELVLVACVAIAGLVVMMSSVHESVVAELRDTTLAVQSSNQTINYNGATGSTSATAGSSWADALDADDGEDIFGSVLGINFNVDPTAEGGAEPTLAEAIESRNYRFEMTRAGSRWTGTGDFDNGIFNASPYWPGTYTISESTITVIFDSLGAAWREGRLVLDGSDPDNLSGIATWISATTNAVWEAAYELISF